MPDDSKTPGDATLSEADVRRVLERAAQIDSAQSGVSASDVTQAAREAGISEKAVIQAMQELLETRELVVAPEGPAGPTAVEARPRSALLVAAAAFGVFVVVLLVLSTVIRLLFP